MNLHLTLLKRFILGMLILPTFVVLLTLHANQTNASKTIESFGTQTSFMPSYIVRDTIQHSLDGVHLLRPADYHIALPVVFNEYCAHPVIDDFSNPASGWPIHDTGNTIYRYLNSEYNIYHREAGLWTAVSRGDFWNRSQKMEATGRIIQNRGVWGLLFGMQNNWSDFYTFEIDPHQQKWYFLRFTSGVGWQLINEGSSHSIHPGSAYNTLSITAPYGELIFRINDTLVLSRSFEYDRTGYIGLTGASFQNNVDIRFNDYLFVDAGCPIPLQNMLSHSTIEFLSLERPEIQEFLPSTQEP